MDRALDYGSRWQGFESLTRRMWKDDFYASVRDYINRQPGIAAVKVTDVYNQAYTCENSLGGSGVDYTCDIYYKTANGGPDRIFTYSGKFSSLIEDIT